MTNTKSLLARLSGGLSMAALALALSLGSSSAVRAADGEMLSPSLQEMVIVPIMRAVAKVDERLAGLEAAAGAWADSFSTRQSVAQRLCIADEGGVQTCFSEGQIDALLRIAPDADIDDSAPVQTQAGAELDESAPNIDQTVSEITTQNAAPESIAAAAPGAVQAEPDVEVTGTVPSTEPAPAAESLQAAPEAVGQEAGPANDQTEPVVSEEPAATNDEPQAESQPNQSESSAPAGTEGLQAAPAVEATEAEAPAAPEATESPQAEPEETGTIVPTDRGAALIFHPQVEISTVVADFGCN